MTIAILSVDDSPYTRLMIAYLLNGVGYELLEAEDGEQAIALAESHHIDLVLTHHCVPKVDGIGLARRLRVIPEYGNTPIVILATEDSTELRLSGWEAGATAWMVKPFDLTKLATIILRMSVGIQPVQESVAVAEHVASPNAVDAIDANTSV